MFSLSAVKKIQIILFCIFCLGTLTFTAVSYADQTEAEISQALKKNAINIETLIQRLKNLENQVIMLNDRFSTIRTGYNVAVEAKELSSDAWNVAVEARSIAARAEENNAKLKREFSKMKK